MKMQTRQEHLVEMLDSYIKDIKEGESKLDDVTVTTRAYSTFAHVEVNFSVEIPLWGE